MTIRLTPREQQVAALIVNWGMSDKAIAARLGISTETVHVHVENIAKKIPGMGRPRHRITVFFLTHIEPDPPPQEG
jgi:DNA-binding CsgD family transcriptional regulator